MTLPVALQDREVQKFTEDDEGNVVVRTSATGTFVPRGLTVGGRVTVLEVNASTWTALPILAGRNAIAIQNENNQRVKINYANDIVGFVGATIFPNGGERAYDIQGSIALYAKSETSTINITIEEIA